MAMAMGDDMAEGIVSAVNLNSLEFKQNGSVLSPEDVAWADSCLIKDPEVSDIDWNAMKDVLKDALLETLISQPNLVDSAGAGKDISPRATDMDILPSNEGTKTSKIWERNADESVQTNGEIVKDNDDHLINEKIDPFRSRIHLENDFLPAYSDNARELGTSDSEVDYGFPEFVKEEVSDDEDIFKVWDLGITAEEDELIKQLNKVLAENSLEQTPSTSDDSEVWKGLKDVSLDDLVSGIAELSLNQSSL